MRWLAFAASLALTTVPIAGSAERVEPANQAAATLVWLHGNWSGEATFMERPAKVTLQVNPGLDSHSTTLTYVAEVTASTTRPAFRFEGRGNYRLEPNGRVTGQWTDSGGNLHPLAGRVTGQSLTVNWGLVQTELGFSKYSLEPDGHLSVSDGVYSQGSARIFAQARYRKAG